MRKRGHEAVHVQDVALRDADDAAIRAYASRNRMVVITKDRDFVPIDATPMQVIWIRTGNVGTHALIDRIDAVLPQLMAHLVEGASLVELR